MAIPGNITRKRVLAAVADFEAGVPHRFGPSMIYHTLAFSLRRSVCRLTKE
jgi:hypothetical protein